MEEELKKECFEAIDKYYNNIIDKKNDRIKNRLKEKLQEIWSPKGYKYFIFKDGQYNKNIIKYYQFNVRFNPKDFYAYHKFLYSETFTNEGIVYKLLANNDCETGCCPTQKIFKITEIIK